jgi:L-threonylcarbamoyladenylate synthase
VSAELKDYLEVRDLILDGGPSLVGVESTIIDCTEENPSILRPGAVTAEMVEESTGIVVMEPDYTKIRVSGSHKQHYAPKARVLIGEEAKAGEGLIAMHSIESPAGSVRLAAPRTIEEYARSLYSALRDGDKQGLEVIHIVPPEGEGLALAIRDRINRAASQG